MQGFTLASLAKLEGTWLFRGRSEEAPIDFHVIGFGAGAICEFRLRLVLVDEGVAIHPRGFASCVGGCGFGLAEMRSAGDGVLDGGYGG